MNLLQWTTKPVLGKLFGGILVSACLVASFALIVFIMSGSASPPIFAGSDEIALVGNQLQIRQGELDLKESTPAIGQIFTTGADLPTYELNQITSRFDNASRTRKFDPGVDLHLVSSDVRPDGQSADMTGALQDRQTDFRNPADIDSLDPNSKFMAMWRCNEGNGNGQHCNASGEKIEAKVTNNDAPGPQAVQSRGLASARITNNGVRMYEVSPSESGGWATRVAGDDTYAYGELIAVEVSFSENVWVSSEATFRVQIGSSRRDLVPVSHRADSVIFATLVRASDEDTDGIWIGDNTSTLDHNPANRFQAVNGGGSVSLTHGSLGTQTSHKVDGRSTRPAINRVRITSSPQHREAYVRGEKVQLEVRFDRPVVVSGNPAARLRIEAFGETTTRTANYASGSGTSTLTFEYFASILDNDSDGIAIPANTLAKDGDIALGTEGGGSIKGIRRTVRANLANGSQGSNGSHKVDARFAAIPEIMANALWGWETRTGTSESVTMDFTIREDPGHFSEEYSLVAAFGWSSIGSTRFGFGIRTDVDDPDSDGSEGKGIVFNRWGTHDKTQARPTDDGWVVTGNILGNFISIRKAYDWGAGDYTVRIAQDGDDDADGRWYGMWILNKSTNVETHMGSLKFPFVDGAPPMINPRQDVYSSMMVILGGSAIKPHEIPVFEVALSPPNEGNGVAPPKRFTATYSNLAGVITNAKLSFDRDSNQLIMRAGRKYQPLQCPWTNHRHPERSGNRDTRNWGSCSGGCFADR